MRRKFSKDQLKRDGAWIVDNLDTLIPLVFAVVIALGETVVDFGERFTRTVTIALLGAIAFALLRERRARTKINDLAAHVEAQDHNLPYEVLEATTIWSISEEGRRAVVSKDTRISLIRDRVSYIEDWWSGDGSVSDYKAQWKSSESGKFIELPVARSFKFKKGDKYLLSFDDERSKGEVLSFKIDRVIEDGYVFTPDSVDVAPWTRARMVRLCIIWSAEKPPTSVEVYRNGKRQQSVDVRQLARGRKDGRSEYAAEFSSVSPNEELKVGWTQ